MFILSFKNGDSDPARDYFDKYYMFLVEIQCLNTLIDSKPFFDKPVKNKQEAYEKLVEMSRNDYCTTGDLFDFSNHQKYYKFIGIYLSRQANMTIPQQIHFIRKLEEDDSAAIFFITEK